MTNLWGNFYQKKLNDSYLSYLKSSYSPFINEINGLLRKGFKVAEMGCGMGNITKILHESRDDFNSICFDNNVDMLRLSEFNLGNDFIVRKHDIVNLLEESFDLIHSHGVLEHLSIDEMKQVIKNQLKMSKRLVHYVPTSKYSYKSFGDEKLLSIKEWKEALNPDESIDFNNSKDLILIWNK